MMQFVGLLALIAFVFTLAALVQVGSLRKEVEQLKAELNKPSLSEVIGERFVKVLV